MPCDWIHTNRSVHLSAQVGVHSFTDGFLAPDFIVLVQICCHDTIEKQRVLYISHAIAGRSVGDFPIYSFFNYKFTILYLPYQPVFHFAILDNICGIVRIHNKREHSFDTSHKAPNRIIKLSFRQEGFDSSPIIGVFDTQRITIIYSSYKIYISRTNQASDSGRCFNITDIIAFLYSSLPRSNQAANISCQTIDGPRIVTFFDNKLGTAIIQP